jgi:acyl-CoA thioester hydrolase
MPNKESIIEVALKAGEDLIMKNVFKIPINVRFRDIDGMGHVNNAVFFTYFAEGRLALFQEFSMDSDFSTFSFILAHISCDYLRPITLNTQLSVEIWVKEIGIKSFGLGYNLVDLSDESITYAKGESVQVCYDYGENKPVAVSAALKQKLIEYQ